MRSAGEPIPNQDTYREKPWFAFLCGCIIYLDYLLIPKGNPADCKRRVALSTVPPLLSLGTALGVSFGVASTVAGLAAPFFTGWITFFLTLGPFTKATEKCVRQEGESEHKGYGSVGETPLSGIDSATRTRQREPDEKFPELGAYQYDRNIIDLTNSNDALAIHDLAVVNENDEADIGSDTHSDRSVRY